MVKFAERVVVAVFGLRSEDFDAHTAILDAVRDVWNYRLWKREATWQMAGKVRSRPGLINSRREEQVRTGVIPGIVACIDLSENRKQSRISKDD